MIPAFDTPKTYSRTIIGLKNSIVIPFIWIVIRIVYKEKFSSSAPFRMYYDKSVANIN